MSGYKLNYDTLAGGNFVEGDTLTFQGGGVGELILLYEKTATTGELYFELISGSVPAAAESITVGGVTANVAVTAFLSRFPLKIRDDLTFTAASGNIRLSGTAPALGTTHSCRYDGQTTNFVVGEILTFGNGSTAELIAQTDNVATGEIFFRMIDATLPADNDTISGAGGGDGNVEGPVHVRCYTPNNIHYWFSDKGDDSTFTGDDEQDRTKPRISRRIGVTDIKLLGNANIDDALSYRIYGGSITQGGTGVEDEYNAVSISVVDHDGTTEPVIIQDAALLSATTTEYWNNGYMPNAASRINMVIKVKVGGTVTDRRVVRFRALEYLRQFFTAPDATLSGGITPVSLVATDDGNNTTAEGTVALWTDIIDLEGYQTVDHGNGNGAQPYWLTLDLGAGGKTKSQGHERMKWIQRRGTAELIHGMNAQLIVGNDLTIDFTSETGTDVADGNTVTFDNGGTALVLAVNYTNATDGTLYCQRLTGDAPISGSITWTGGSATITGTPTTRLIINNVMGTYTGSAFNPANIGVTLLADDADENDLFRDLLNVEQQPPTNRSGSVTTAVGNTVTAYPWDGTAVDAVGDQEPDFNRLTKNLAEVGASVTSITVNETIPTWMPKTGGFIRITRTSGIRTLHQVTDWNGSTFTIPAADFSGDGIDANAGIMPAPIDEVATGSVTSFSGVYTADQDGDGTGDQKFVVRVSNGSGPTPKQPSTNEATFTSNGFSLNVTLQDD